MNLAAPNASPPWLEANQAYLNAAVNTVIARIQWHLDGDARDVELSEAREREARFRDAMPAPPALDRLAGIFSLSSFERDVLLLAAATQLGPELQRACRTGDLGSHPTFGLALAALPDPHWSALVATAPLRSHGLIELGEGERLVDRALFIDEHILHQLTGISAPDPRLLPWLRPLPEPGAADSPDHPVLAELTAQLQSGAGPGPIRLHGTDFEGLRKIAQAACHRFGLRLFEARADLLPIRAVEQQSLARLWSREALLAGSALLIDLRYVSDERRAELSALYPRLSGLVFLGSRALHMAEQHLLGFDIEAVGVDVQLDRWAALLGPEEAALRAREVEQVAGHFALGIGQMQAATVRSRLGEVDLWDACRQQARAGLDALAQRIEARAGWDDLVLPAAQREQLETLVAQVRHRRLVYDAWGFASNTPRGHGIAALFSGPSGTGKTLAAEVVGAALRLDVYRVDLSQIVSKYIGETEKNLRRIFDAAEAGAAILLFDEADALFGKRSEVKDSHDRYANIEVSYLLQRMEAYRGLAILTTNLPDALDSAFLRRLRVVVKFPFPNAASRAAIWRRTLPPSAPTEGLEIERLAQLDVAGGNIVNIALNAAFRAAREDEPIRPAHVLAAARSEYVKLGRTMTRAEISGWG